MKTILLIAAMCILLGSCKREFEPINYGKEACSHCKMTIVDKRYAAEMITKKGKVFKFDDLVCMKKFIQENNMSDQVGNLYVASYKTGDNNILDVQKAVFLHNEFFRTPMNGDCAAFSHVADANALKDSLHAEVITWNTIN